MAAGRNAIVYALNLVFPPLPQKALQANAGIYLG
jgi:hypothetical protein